MVKLHVLHFHHIYLTVSVAIDFLYKNHIYKLVVTFRSVIHGIAVRKADLMDLSNLPLRVFIEIIFIKVSRIIS